MLSHEHKNEIDIIFKKKYNYVLLNIIFSYVIV